MKPIYLLSDDYNALSKIVNQRVRAGAKAPPFIEKLHQELRRAIILNPTAIPATTVTLNSRTRLRDLATDEAEEWILTMPEYADPEQQRISVLAPVGTAILGFSEGDEIEWETPGGLRKLRIETVEHRAFTPPNQNTTLFGLNYG